jgi:hypothetical protein
VCRELRRGEISFLRRSFSIGSRFTEWIFIFFCLGEKSSQSLGQSSQKQTYCSSFEMTGRKQHPPLVLSSRRGCRMINCVQIASPRRDLIPTKEYLPSEADLPSGYLFSFASVKKVLHQSTLTTLNNPQKRKTVSCYAEPPRVPTL